jgi:poly(A) polymerase
MRTISKYEYAYKSMAMILSLPDPTQALINYVGTGEMANCFPELQEMVEFTTKAKSKNLWNHVLHVVRNTPANNPTLRWAALFHDVGKPATVYEDGDEVTFHGHEVVGEKIWKRVANRLEVDLDLKKNVALLIRLHLQLPALSGAPGLTDRSIRKFVRVTGDQFENLYALAIADISTSKEWRTLRAKTRCKRLKERIEKLIENDNKVVPRLPKGLGHRLYDTLGYSGPALGEAMNYLKSKLLAGEIEETDDMSYYVRILANKIAKEKGK